MNVPVINQRLSLVAHRPRLLRHLRYLPIGVLVVLASLLTGPISFAASVDDSEGTSAGAPAEPAYFIENCGQVDSEVRFIARTPVLDAYFTAEGVVLSLRSHGPEGLSWQSTLRWAPLGARSPLTPRGESRLEGVVNIYRGEERFERLARWSRLVYEEVYPGIDLVYSVADGSLKTDWIVAPGVDPDRIRWHYEGADGVELLQGGSLEIRTGLGVLEEDAPVLYQETSSGRRVITGGYRVLGDAELGFWTGSFDPTLPLIIDPGIQWSTYLGGSDADQAQYLTLDSAGAVYVAGFTSSLDFPLTDGSFDHVRGPFSDPFISKFSAGGQLIYSTYMGGSSTDGIFGIATDASGNLYFGGRTNSSDFPVTPGAFDTQMDGVGDGLIGKLDAAGGTLIYATFLGGSTDSQSGDEIQGLAIDAAGNAYVCGTAYSSDFPTTPGAFDTTFQGPRDAFVAKLDPSGSSLIYSTLLGGDVSDEGTYDIAVDASGAAHVVGYTTGPDFPTTPGAFDRTSYSGFVTKLDPTGSSLTYSTYLGSTGVEPSALALNDLGEVCVVGRTSDAAFNVTPGAFDTTYNGLNDAFVLLLDSTGSQLLFSTFVGGYGNETAYDVAWEAVTGDWHVAGYSQSPDYPTTLGALDRHISYWDGVLSVFDATGRQLIYSTFHGGYDIDQAHAIALDGIGGTFLCGNTRSTDFPVTLGAYDRIYNGGSSDAFVTRLQIGPILRFQGLPAPGQSVFYGVTGVDPSEAGHVALVYLSTSGTQGIRMPGGQILPLTFDPVTLLGIQLGALLQGVVGPNGQAATPVTSFPPVPSGLTVYSAAATWDLASTPKVFSVTLPMTFVTQ